MKAVLIILCTAIVVSACSALKTTVVTKPDGVRELRQYDAQGRIVRVESYYVTDRGKKVLHGSSEEWSPPGGLGLRRVYDHGALIRTSRIVVSGTSGS